MASKTAVERYQLNPLARLIGGVWTGGEAWRFPEVPILAVNKLLDKLKMKIYDFDLFENNEAFALSNVLFNRELGVPYEKLNVYGGAIALGHPIGASGARILVTLLNALQQQNGQFGLAAVCHGTGGGTAIALERLGLVPGFLEANLSILRSQISVLGQKQIILDYLLKVEMPTLVVWGINDLVLPNYQAQDAVSRLKQGHLALIPNCGHLPQVERPELFTDALNQFLAYHL
ncbi:MULTISPECIES: hypothetical protein [Nostoc]|uniref:hypothetical protein n=1 Tax=Nostoc TaxID=1177 RepID=UPI001F552D49|nr:MULTISPECIES: hypothetical protein [Nostoc]